MSGTHLVRERTWAFPECSYLGKILKATIKELSGQGRKASQPKQQLHLSDMNLVLCTWNYVTWGDKGPPMRTSTIPYMDCMQQSPYR